MLCKLSLIDSLLAGSFYDKWIKLYGRYIWDKIILKISAQTVISFKSYDTSKLDGKLKIGKTRGDRQLGCIFESK